MIAQKKYIISNNDYNKIFYLNIISEDSYLLFKFN